MCPNSFTKSLMGNLSLFTKCQYKNIYLYDLFKKGLCVIK